mgnify:CR=1 FL=1
MFTATTILAVKKDGQTAVAGDGQVTMGNAVVMKNTARKVRRLYHGKVIAGFAGSVADAFALFDKFEGKLSDCNGNLVRAAVEFAKEWRRDRVLQKLEALLIMTDGDHLFLYQAAERLSSRMTAYWQSGAAGIMLLLQLALCVRCRIYRRGRLRNGHSM